MAACRNRVKLDIERRWDEDEVVPRGLPGQQVRWCHGVCQAMVEMALPHPPPTTAWGWSGLGQCQIWVNHR